MDNCLGIAIGAELMTFLDQFLPKLLVIPYLAVKHKPDITRFVAHWLVSAAEVNDAQARKAQAGRPVEICTLIVRSSMLDQVRHLLDERGRHRFAACHIKNPAYTAHTFYNPLSFKDDCSPA